jgi:hypothetical protein
LVARAPAFCLPDEWRKKSNFFAIIGQDFVAIEFVRATVFCRYLSILDGRKPCARF